MSAKGKKEKKDEEVEFAQFAQYCKGGKPMLQKQINKAAETIETLTAEIGKLKADAKTLGGEIGALQSEVTKFEADKKESDAEREKDHAAFLEEEKDYSESVDALERAVVVLQEKDGNIPGASLLQLTTSDKLPMQAKSIISAFLGMSVGDDYSPPEANAYESQSGGIIEMLKKLKDEFRTKLSDCQKEEMNSKNAYDMVQQDLIDSIENSNTDIEEKTASKESKIEKRAMDTKELASTEEAKASDEDLLNNLDTECKQKTASFEEKQQLRADEIEALAKATEILSDGDVAAGGKHLGLAQSGTSFVQSERSERFLGQSEGIHRQLREFLASEAQRLHSKNLGLLSEKIGADPFAKVKKMIDTMITKLLEEANADAEKEGWCDTEMGKSKVTRNKLSEQIDGLDAAIEDGKGTIMKLTQELADLADEIKDLDGQQGESTALREEEQAKNEATIADAQGAQKAVAAATAVLKEFYAKAASATALLQTKTNPALLSKGIKMGTDELDALANPNFDGTIDKGHKEGQQTFGEKFTGNQDAAGGVMALLEVALSDFANLEADTKASEAEGVSSYKAMMVETKKSKAVKSKKIEMDQADRASAESKLQEDIAELKSTQDELIAADKYHEKLVPQCIDQGMSWEEVQKARQDEIGSLKEALEILGRQGSVDTSA
jgi:predicted  nucleic acid-binding Zn-ribbon protein/HAMP domain-containing protein